LRQNVIDPLNRIYERLLVLRCQTGDERAFAELVGRYSPRLRIFLRKMLGEGDSGGAGGGGGGHAVEDVLQDVWFDVFRGVGRLQDLEAFAGWLYRIARDRAYRVLRRRRAVKTQAMDEIDLPASSANDDVTSDDERRLVHASLDRLPHAQREVLLLRFIEDMSYEQIASTVGCGVGTVRSRLHYAKRALRELMEGNNRHDQRQ